MNFAMVLKSLGILLICEAGAMVPSLGVALIYKGNDIMAFIYTIILLTVTGIAMMAFAKPKSTLIYARDGFAIVAIGWILISFFGCMPFVFSGAIPSWVDSFFEASSGFTTTGATILAEIESLPRGILFWRSFTHWIGGMGVLVMTLAILPSVGAGGLQIMKAESTGPNPGKLVPKVGQSAKILYGIYIVITFILVALLVAAGMPVYDAFIHAFGTVGTGGFSNMNRSVSAYNNVYIEVIITVFMLACGMNFALYYQALKGGIKNIFKDDEFKFYMGVVTVSIILITINLTGPIYTSIWESLRHSSFQVASIITTTGYFSTDFNMWPTLSKMILLILMLIGGCAGSTAGAIKDIRILLLLKAGKRELLKILHPRAVYSVRLGGKAVEEETLSEVLAFFFMYMAVFIILLIIVSFDGFDLVTTISAVATSLGNVGPGLEVVGPIGNFSPLSSLSKIALSFGMITGRIEIYPILLLMMPTFWKKVNI